MARKRTTSANLIHVKYYCHQLVSWSQLLRSWTSLQLMPSWPVAKWEKTDTDNSTAPRTKHKTQTWILANFLPEDRTVSCNFVQTGKKVMDMSKGVLDYLVGSTSCLTACSCLIRMGDDGSGRPGLTRTCNGMLHRACSCCLYIICTRRTQRTAAAASTRGRIYGHTCLVLLAIHLLPLPSSLHW